MDTEKNSPHPKYLIPAILLALAAVFPACEMPGSKPAASLNTRGWEENAGTWYQIFTGSYYDSNGDGIGDLNGIALKLDYLNDSGSLRHKQEIDLYGECNRSLHVDGIWLTPIMPSPSYHKYDTKDYKNIDPSFGTLKDFQNLLKKCHDHGIKLIIDLVMNHSSEQHPWFQEALKEVRAGRPGRYASYYNFYYGATPPETYKFKTAESGGLSSYYKFWGRAAENAWFEGSFWTGMPDLNWDSKALRKEFEEVVDFWLSAGLDGFRLDATSWPYNYRGMDLQNDGVHGDNKNIELWTWFNDTCKKINPNVYLVGECWEGSGTIANYYRSGMNFFAFDFSTQNGKQGTIYHGVTGHGKTFASTLEWWERTIKQRNPGALAAPFLSNHDQTRSSMFLLDNERKMAASLLIFSPGTPFIYYGEEIGLTSPAYESPDANRRGPMYWSNANSAGRPDPPPEWNWWQMAPAAGEGVEEQLQNENSLLRYYIRAGNLKKKYPWLAYASIENLNKTGDEAVAAYRLRHEGKSIIVTHNTDYSNQKDINLPNARYYEGFSVHGWTDKGPFPGGVFSLPAYSTVVFSE
ncbi:MAG: hypothetical protein LBK02_08380 [Treponema sp.]|jgi:alpha-amylase|nr:hypothetical protein [Treponema sp.]